MKALTTLCLLLTTQTALADIPQTIDTDGPTQGTQPLALEELWRAGGDDGNVIFGRVVDIVGSADGHVYVMDNQLCQVSVFSPDGTFTGTLGREGDGPGEVRQPIGVVLMDDDMVGLGSGFPGRVICLNTSGSPSDTLYPIGEPSDGNVGVMISLQYVDGILGATGGRLVLDPTGQNENYAERFLAICDGDCSSPVRILEKRTPLDPTGQRFVEKDDYYIDQRWVLGPGGFVYTAMDRAAYEISVYDRTGKLQRVFGRDYSPRKRTDQDKAEVIPVINIAGRVAETVAEDYDACVNRIAYDHLNDHVWVLTGHGAADQPDGVLETWDIFSTEGEYLRQVPIPLGHQMNEGTSFLVGGGRLVVLRGSGTSFEEDLDADETDAAEVEPYEVICYRMR